jgi:hypothetical protein
VAALSGHARATPAAAGQDRPPIRRPVSEACARRTDAGNPLVRLCEGRGSQHPRLLGRKRASPRLDHARIIQLFVDRIAVALQDAGIASQQSKRALAAAAGRIGTGDAGWVGPAWRGAVVDDIYVDLGFMQNLSGNRTLFAKPSCISPISDVLTTK